MRSDLAVPVYLYLSFTINGSTLKAVSMIFKNIFFLGLHVFTTVSPAPPLPLTDRKITKILMEARWAAGTFETLTC